jgi:GTP-binding protein
MDAAFIKSAFDEAHYPPADLPEVAFAGRSNVGKSSLINVLVNRKSLARTSSRPGRTQAINFFVLNQWIYFVDLPGYGYADVPLRVKQSWQRMVETYLNRRENLQAVVVILDVRRNPSGGDLDLLNWLKHAGIPAIPVLTKADKLSRQQALNQARMIARQLRGSCLADPILFSAKTRQGQRELWWRIEEAIET